MAIELHMRKGAQGLIPATQMDWQLIQKLPADKPIYVKVFKPRSGKHHRKFFGLLGKAFRQQEEYTNEDRFRAYITCRAGFADVIDAPVENVAQIMSQKLADRSTPVSQIFFEDLPGNLVRLIIPQSIAWDKMDQTQFTEFYERALDVLQIEFGIDVEKLEDDKWGGDKGYGI